MVARLPALKGLGSGGVEERGNMATKIGQGAAGHDGNDALDGGSADLDVSARECGIHRGVQVLRLLGTFGSGTWNGR